MQSLAAELGPDLRPISGSSAPKTPVTAVHISELTDPAPWLAGGELLLTTGLSLTPEGSVCRSYVERLVAAGVVALGLGLGPVHDEVPSALEEACRECELPLLVIPPPTPFLTVTRAYWTAVARSGASDAREQLAAQRSLVDAAAQRDPAEAILRTLATWLHSWAAQFTSAGDVVRVHPPEAMRHARVVGEALRRENVTAVGPALAGPHGGRRPITLPLESGGHRVGYLAVGASRQTGPVTRSTVRTAAGLLGLATSRDSLDGASREAHWAGMAALLCAGMIPAARCLAEAAGMVVPGEAVRLLAVRTAAPAPMLSTLVGWQLPTAGMRVDARHLWYVLPADLPPREVLAARIAHLDVRASATLSMVVPLADCGSERARRLAILDELPDGVLDLHRVRSSEVASRLDRLTDPVLLASLSAYLRHRGQWESASRTMGVHRNTLRHRIGRAARLMELDLDDPDVSAVLWLTLRGHPTPTAPHR